MIVGQSFIGLLQKNFSKIDVLNVASRLFWYGSINNRKQFK